VHAVKWASITQPSQNVPWLYLGSEQPENRHDSSTEKSIHGRESSAMRGYEVENE
jgi:hypothetical protein